MQILLLIIHVLLAISLVTLVLLQHGKGADAGAAFGSGASATVFGARGSASFLSRVTAILAALFFATSLGLSYLSGRGTGPRSVAEQIQTAPRQLPAGAGAPAAVPKAPSSDVPALPQQPAPGKPPAGK